MNAQLTPRSILVTPDMCTFLVDGDEEIESAPTERQPMSHIEGTDEEAREDDVA